MNWGRIVGILGNFFGNCGDLSEIVGRNCGGFMGRNCGECGTEGT